MPRHHRLTASPRGQQSARAFLSEAQVADIRASRWTRDELARYHAVSARTIDAIRSGARWAHMEKLAPGRVRRKRAIAQSPDPPYARLRRQDIDFILASDWPDRRLARRFGIHLKTVRRIRGDFTSTLRGEGKGD